MINQDNIEDYKIRYVNEDSLDFSNSASYLSVQDLLDTTALLQSEINFTKLDLSFNKFGAEVIASIISSLKNIEDFVSFDLSDNIILDEESSLLMPDLLAAINLQKLDLSFNLLEDGEVIDQLKYLTKLKELNLDNSDISGLNISNLAEVLKSLTSLERLFLAGNEICSQGLELLAESLPTSLIHLNLESNDIDDKGIIALAKVLPNTKGLKTLNLSYNNISDEGINILVSALPHTKIEVLNLQGVNISALTKDLILARVKSNHNFITKIEGLSNSDQINTITYANKAGGYVAAIILEGGHLPEVLAHLVKSYVDPLVKSIKLASVLEFLPRQLTMNMSRLNQVSSRLLHQSNDAKIKPNLNDNKESVICLSDHSSQDFEHKDNCASHHIH